MSCKLMKYSNVPAGSEWRDLNSETEYMKLANGDSMSPKGTFLSRHPNEQVILVGLIRKGKSS